ncbi:Hpt domain-containing protein [Pseudodesulfovibrio sp.]|uniref:Hpt domain-containing protein n=1 Tax=Pseudodesulfovibrio sp. TaxID=2035812 RepID=UPI0026020098|nr:Hpt domain-containing protein [Pseudodesulfovibrio sp.]MDD3312694.1 Hpt domain-containing protein [Pseudodesulfovibrio sp.]
MPTVIVDGELEAIIPRYFELQRQGLADLRAAVERGDAESARLIGHRMKGTGTSYGFPNLTELGAAIEGAALAGDLAGAGRLGAEAESFLDAVRVVYGEVKP